MDDRRSPKRPGPPPRPDLGNREQVRRLRRGMERSAAEVVRCQTCGAQIPAGAAVIGPRTACESCGTPLHSCRHCRHFDTSARFQCARPRTDPMRDKNAANDCSEFEPRLVLDATGRRLQGRAADDAKSAFDALFKKP